MTTPHAEPRTLVVVPVIELRDEWLGYDPRHLSADALSRMLHVCEVGSSTRRALLSEQRRRREMRARIFAAL